MVSGLVDEVVSEETGLEASDEFPFIYGVTVLEVGRSFLRVICGCGEKELLVPNGDRVKGIEYDDFYVSQYGSLACSAECFHYRNNV
ncbi:MAG: hypothetical protein ABIH37_00375 [archaeon]